jgi:hypothetical protein
MKTKILVCSIILLSSAFAGNVFGWLETDWNTFYGKGSGASNTGDYYDTFYGAYAGTSNTTGFHNTFLGSYTAYFNTTADDNTFIGSHSGYSNTTGFDNTLIGSHSGYSNTTGEYNTFLGLGAGYSNNTGSNNTFIGKYAGNYNTTGSGNVFLGASAGYNETRWNKLYIANSDTSAPLVYGEFDNKKMTINGNLEVVGPDNGLVRLSDTTTDNTIKRARLVLNHYSNTELPVYLFGSASTATANFVAFGGGATIGNAATQLDLFTAPNTTTPAGFPRLTIIGNGNVGIGTQSPTHPLQMAGGAYSNGASWLDGSSRE